MENTNRDNLRDLMSEHILQQHELEFAEYRNEHPNNMSDRQYAEYVVSFSIPANSRYWLKIIHEEEDFCTNKANPTGMSWGSIKKVRTISNDPNKQYGTINAYQQVSISNPVIIKISKSNEIRYGTFTKIQWGNTQGLAWNNLNGHDWENFFWIENAKQGIFKWADHKINLQFLSQFPNLGHAFMCGMWEIQESDYQYIISNIIGT